MYAPAHSRGLWKRQEGTGSPVVLLHGLGDDLTLWRHQFGALGARHRIVAMDLPGHGRTRLGPGDHSLADMAADVWSAIVELGLEKPVVIGLSMGGGIAQSLAIRHPNHIRGLVLVSTSSEFPDATRARFITRAARAEREGMTAVIDDTVPRWFTTEFTERHPDEVELTRRTVLATDPRSFAAASRANAARNLTADLRQIACPVLFVGGAKDPADPVRAVQIFRRELPLLRSEIIPDASHLVPVEAPAAFNAILLRFLDEIEPTATAAEGEST